MVSGPALTDPKGPRRGRRSPNRGRILLRRALALTVVASALALVAVVVATAVGTFRDEPPPPPPPVAKAPPKLRIIFPEGFTRREMAARVAEVDRIALQKRKVQTRLSSRQYLAASAGSPFPGQFTGDGRARPLEGFLFPATYEFVPATTSAQLVQKQLATFRREWAKIDLAYARSRNLTPYDVLIIASMIEKEVIAPKERRLVAAVIYNRLKRGMSLGIDATIRYALNVPATESLRESHLENRTPYNTRLHSGLTPTPIANPGLASMQAAAHPAQVDYLFFVRKPDKVHHFFTASQREFDNYSIQHGYVGG